jgi:hypothetical protein
VGDLASDTFSRTTSNGWGTATSGHPWAVAGATSRYLVAGGMGSIRLTTAGTDGTTTLTGPSSTSSELRLDLSFDKVGASLYAGAIVRRINASNDYRVKVIMSTSGRIRLQWARRVNGVETVLLDTQLPATITNVAGRTFSLAVQATGSSPTTLRAKLWVTGQPEPAAWQASVQDSTAALQVAGGVGINHYFSSSGGSLSPLTLSIDNLRLIPVA